MRRNAQQVGVHFVILYIILHIILGGTICDPSTSSFGIQFEITRIILYIVIWQPSVYVLRNAQQARRVCEIFHLAASNGSLHGAKKVGMCKNEITAPCLALYLKQ